MLYLLGAGSLIIQILCVIHAVRTGRNQIWIWVIMIGSLLGCTAYFAFELMPELFGPGSRYARKARDRVRTDPVNALQSAEANVARADTAASREALGDAQMLAGAPREAAQQYRTALDRVNGSDAGLETKLANALLQAGEYREALTSLDRIPVPLAIGEADRLSYLRAQVLAAMGQQQEAATIYADIVARMPGIEPSCRYGALLVDMKRWDEAVAILAPIGRMSSLNAKSAEEAEMIAWAHQTVRGIER
jgi:hypothetical protein